MSKSFEKGKIRIAPSVLSADFSALRDEIKMMESAGADWVHLDVMDGHFVPNITFGPAVVASMRKNTGLVFDAHLMITEPDKYAEAFIKAGSDCVTFHVEAVKEKDSALALIRKIRKTGARAGISLNPGTETGAIEPYLSEVDLVLVMSVWPGFGGQSFIPGTLQHVRRIRNLMGGDFDIAIDGGMNIETVTDAARAGANIIVAGSAVFGADDPAGMIKDLKKKATDYFMKD